MVSVWYLLRKKKEGNTGFLLYPNLPFLQSNAANDVQYATYRFVFGRFLEKSANL